MRVQRRRAYVLPVVVREEQVGEGGGGLGRWGVPPPPLKKSHGTTKCLA